MSGTSLFDLSPAGSLMVLAALIACLPAWWVWRRHRSAPPQRRRMALCVLILFLTFDLILVGAFTRLTDSGLGCPDWPGCYGQSSPFGAHAEISSAQQSMPTGPVTHKKAWIEMAHRYLASGVGALILLMTVIAWRDTLRGAAAASIGPWWPTATLVWVITQGIFGALTVTMKLFPAIVTLHLLGAYALVAMLVVQVVQWQRAAATGDLASGKAQHAGSDALRAGGAATNLFIALPAPLARGIRAALWIGLCVLLLQATSGAWVSTNYAVLVCGDFPTCQGVWWPAMDFAEALELWRPLGQHADGSMVSFQALTAIHMVHRMMAVATLLVLGWLVFKLWPMAGLAGLARPVRYLLGLLVLQVVTGLSNVVLDWPMAAAMLHTGGAGALVGVLVWMLSLTHGAQREITA